MGCVLNSLLLILSMYCTIGSPMPPHEKTNSILHNRNEGNFVNKFLFF